MKKNKKEKNKVRSKAVVLREVLCDLRIVISDMKAKEKALAKHLNGENRTGEYKSGYVFSEVYRRDMEKLNIERRRNIGLLTAILEGRRLIRKKNA